MNFEFVPYRSVGEIQFGQHREEIKNKLDGITLIEFKKDQADANPTDFFDDSFFIYYDADNNVEAIEFANEQGNALIFMEKNLLDLSYQGIIDFLASLGENVGEDASGFDSYKFGFGVYAPDKEDDRSCRIESIMAFKLGYSS